MENEVVRQKGPGFFAWLIPVALLAIFLLSLYSTAVFQDYAFKLISVLTTAFNASPESPDATEDLIAKSWKNVKSQEKELSDLIPSKPYIIINTTANRFSLRESDGDTIRNGLCSTGKDEILIDKNNKPYVFRTPRGQFSILNKRTNPVWVKPDWAFVEEGESIPSARSAKRIDENTLGDYALGLGDGYMIHGTLYQRRLGYGETHGCIRMGDADLEVVYNTLTKGSQVFIY